MLTADQSHRLLVRRGGLAVTGADFMAWRGTGSAIVGGGSSWGGSFDRGFGPWVCLQFTTVQHQG